MSPIPQRVMTLASAAHSAAAHRRALLLLSGLLLGLVLWLGGFVQSARAAGTAAAAEAAGKVVLASGGAWRLREGTRLRMPLAAGAEVFAGDSLQTAADGHVYLKMRDGGFLVLRPDSRAVIDDYRFDAARPAEASVRLRLDSGVMRTITGDGLKGAKDRFRLNTPLAAIGVRGTDFTTYADAEATRVSVVEGGVVVAPLGNGCAAAGLGPCTGERALELQAGRPGLVLVLGKGDARPRLQAADERAPDRVRPPLPDEPKPAAGAQSSTERTGAPLAGPVPRQSSTDLPGDLTEAQIIARLDRITVDAPVVDPPPAVPAASFHWGRWREIAGRPANIDLEQRLSEGDRYVSSNYSHALTRVPGEIVLPSGGVVSFDYTGGEALFRAGSSTTSAAISNPQLSVDFARRTFSTRLDATALGITWQVRANGDVASNGEFRSAWRGDTNSTVRGVLGGARGQEAAYLFTRTIDPERQITGATTWSRP